MHQNCSENPFESSQNPISEIRKVRQRDQLAWGHIESEGWGLGFEPRQPG